MKHVTAATIGLAIGLTLIVAAPAYPHGGGVIRVASKQVAVGGTIALTGEKFEKNAELRLELRGVLDNYPAGRVRSDANGKLSASITIPPAVPIGAYTLVAIADDGDVTARTDLAVGPAPDVAASKEGDAPHGDRDAGHAGHRGNDENRANHDAGRVGGHCRADFAQLWRRSIFTCSLEGHREPLASEPRKDQNRSRTLYAP